MQSVNEDKRKEGVPEMRGEHGGSKRACYWMLLSDEWCSPNGFMGKMSY